MDDVKKQLPAEPSRATGRLYMWAILGVAAVEIVAVTTRDFEYWAVLGAINAMVVAGFAIAKSATTLDLNKWMDSAVRMVEARGK